MIKRDILSAIRNHIFEKEITFIVGARQVGKTTIMNILADELKAKGEKVALFNLDFYSDKELFSSQQYFIDKIESLYGKEKVFLFVDEIQRIPDAAIFLKGIYDKGYNFKFIVSGSGSIELKAKTKESLTGRKLEFIVLPVSFTEFVNYKTKYEFEDNIIAYLSFNSEKTLSLLKEYIAFGGYPRIVTEENPVNKRNLINEIFSSYVEKDIKQLMNVEKDDVFLILVRLLAASSGKLLNHKKLSSETSLSLPTLMNYLYYAEKTYLIDLIKPYFRSHKKEITKAPVVNFNDTGIRNYALGLYGNENTGNESGFIFQNFIYLLIRDILKNKGYKINYWRTNSGAEVDFVIDKINDLIPIEVKYTSLKSNSISRSLRSFIQKYNPGNAYIINLTANESVVIENTKVHIIPFYQIVEHLK